MDENSIAFGIRNNSNTHYIASDGYNSFSFEPNLTRIEELASDVVAFNFEELVRTSTSVSASISEFVGYINEISCLSTVRSEEKPKEEKEKENMSSDWEKLLLEGLK